MTRTPPNIVLIQADQHRADALGVNGHPIVATPNLDRLAREGVNFSYAFTPIPLCTPARTSLLTGLWPSQHGCIANHDTEAFRPMRFGLPTVPHALRKAGYRLAHVGKWHVGDERNACEHGFHVDVAERDYTAWRAEQNMPPRPRENGWFGEADPYIGPEQSRLAWGADRVIEQIQHADAASPFFIQWDTSEPHLPNVVPDPFASMYAPESLPPWPSFPDPLIDKPFVQRQQQETWGVSGWTWTDWSPTVARYLGEVTLLDHQVGRVLAELDRLGLAEQTFVIYTADHGDLCGGHGMADKHFVMYDDVVHVPLLMRWPARLASGIVCDAFVSSAIDLASTLCDAAGVRPPSGFAGQNLLDLLSGGLRPRGDIFASYHGNQLGLYSQRMVRDRSWKYVWNATAEDELYDLANDPGEIVNLARVPTFSAELSRLRARTVAWMEETDDPLLNEWTRRQLSPDGACKPKTFHPDEQAT